MAISFHSLEDRLAKRFFRLLAGRPAGGADTRPADARPAPVLTSGRWCH